jgi:glutamate-1-semialdehyde 2,1-aminomutase
MGGAQEYYNVLPDLTIMGKVIGGGFPVGAFSGPEAIMELLDHNKYSDPSERSAHGGTFTGNPITMVAGCATVDSLKNGIIHKHIDRLGEKMRNKLQEIFNESKYPASVTGIGSTFGIHFQEERPMNAGDTAKNNLEMTRSYFQYMLETNIIYMSPTVSHSWISSPHTDENVEAYLAATEEFIRGYKS